MNNKITIQIAGMHCRSCELLVEDSLSEVSGVRRSVVNFKKGTAEIHFDQQKPEDSEIEKAIRGAGYSIGNDNPKTWLSKNPEEYKDLILAGIFLLGLFIIAKNFGLTKLDLSGVSNPSSLGVVFLVGITAGLSTCMAMVGGLILGIAARHNEKHPEASAMQKFRPHLFFNLGRIGGYAFFGAILGSLGSALQMSGLVLGILTIAVGLVMLALGVKLLGIFPRLENVTLSLPTSVAKLLGIKKEVKEYSHRGSMLTGALTFFLPCGFTQAMQLFAVSSGSPVQGAMIMGVFALGTTPGLLGVGAITSVVKGIFAKRFFKFAGILVIILAFFNITNGFNLAGWQFSMNNNQSTSASLGRDGQLVISNKIVDPNVKMENGVQMVNMVENNSGYAPNKFTIKKGVPVRWVIDAQAPNSCASSILVSSLNIRKFLTAGQNVIEFTPTVVGKVPFSCGMGMYTGSFTVMDDQGNGAPAVDEKTPSANIPKGVCTMQGCGN